MYDVNEILARIQKGEKPEDIANECAKAINDAISLDKKQKEEAAAVELQKKTEKEAKLNKYAQDMADAMINYFTTLDPEITELMDEQDAFDAAEVRKTLDASYAAVKSMLALASVMSDSKPTPTPKKSDDDYIKDFLKSFGL